MNLIGEKIDADEAKCREFNAQEFLGLLRMRLTMFLSWGCHAFKVDSNNTRLFRMKVNGVNHKGHVYVFLNSLDLYDIYLTTTRGTILIRTPEEGIYFDMVSDWLDNRIDNSTTKLN